MAASCAGKQLTVGEALALARPALALCGVGLQEVPEQFERERAQLRAAGTGLAETVETLQARPTGEPAGARGVEACRGASQVYDVAAKLGGPPGSAFVGARNALGIVLGLEKDNVVRFPGGMGAATDVQSIGPTVEPAPSQQVPVGPKPKAEGVPRGVVFGILAGALAFGVGLGAAIVSGRRVPQGFGEDPETGE